MKRVLLLAALMAIGIGPVQAAEPNYVFKHMGIACRDKGHLKELKEFVLAGDKVALRSALGSRIARRECTSFEKGTRVYLTDSAVFEGLAKVRKEGAAASFWTPVAALTHIN